MNWQMFNEVWNLDLPANEQLVLLAYVSHVNKDDSEHKVWPSNGLIGWKIGVSEDTVIRIKKKLLARNILVLEEKMIGRANQYRIDLSQATRKQPFRYHPQVAGGQPPETTRNLRVDHPQVAGGPPAQLCGTNREGTVKRTMKGTRRGRRLCPWCCHRQCQARWRT